MEYAKAKQIKTEGGISVEEALGLKVEEAPTDGKKYARKDGSWVEISSGTADQFPGVSVYYWPTDYFSSVSVTPGSNDDGDVVIDWVYESGDPDHYDIYKDTNPIDPEYLPPVHDTISGDSTSWTDTDPDDEYYYGISDGEGNIVIIDPNGNISFVVNEEENVPDRVFHTVYVTTQDTMEHEELPEEAPWHYGIDGYASALFQSLNGEEGSVGTASSTNVFGDNEMLLGYVYIVYTRQEPLLYPDVNITIVLLFEDDLLATANSITSILINGVNYPVTDLNTGLDFDGQGNNIVMLATTVDYSIINPIVSSGTPWALSFQAD